MDITRYLLAEFDETVARLRSQVLELVPVERQKERMPGGNSITWATWHVARHASLALSVVGFEREPSSFLSVVDPVATAGGSGLQEVEQDWLAGVPSAVAAEYAFAVFADVRRYLATLDADTLERRVDVAAALRAAQVDETVFGWLYRMWDQPVTFLVRWPLTGHIINHVGEMIATRNQMGLSPFR